MSRLRRAYFANSAERAARYGVNFDRVLIHLWRSRRTGPPLVLRTVAHVDDLVHAVACIDNGDRAWADLAEQNEPALMRVVRRQLDEMDAIVFVRKLLADLRSQRAEASGRRVTSLAGYRGTQPLRSWLVDRALGRLAQVVVMQAAHVRSRRPGTDRTRSGSVRANLSQLAVDLELACPADHVEADESVGSFETSSSRSAGPMTLEPGA